jgi:hypothetical protein
LVLGHPIKKRKSDCVKTNLEKERDYRGIFSYAKVDDDIYNATILAGKHCPRLHQILVSGAKGSDIDERIINPVTTVVKKDKVLRLWSYDDFALDYMLALQFNYEYLSASTVCTLMLYSSQLMLQSLSLRDILWTSESTSENTEIIASSTRYCYR